MGTLFSYSITSSIIIALLFPILYMIINRSTAFRFNRATLLCAIGISLMLPIIIKFGFTSLSIEPRIGNTGIQETISTPSIPDNLAMNVPDEINDKFPWNAVLIIIYISGVFLLFCREILSYSHLLILMIKCKKYTAEGFTICKVSHTKIAPFSWGRYIFINETDFGDDFNTILLHEKAHITHHHWTDLIFVDIFCMFLWYNPCVWYVRQYVKLNHEFEADDAVIRSGVDTYSYQRLLIEKAMGNKVIPIANSLGYGKRGFRKRVLTISKKHSSGKTKRIVFLAIPAILIASIAITSPVSASFISSFSYYKLKIEIKNTLSEKKDSTILSPTLVHLSQISILNADSPITELNHVSNKPAKEDSLIILPSPLKDQTELHKQLQLYLSTIEKTKDTKVNLTIIVDEEGKVKNVITDKTDDPLIKTIVEQAVKGIRFEQMTHNGKPIETRFNIPVIIKKKQ